MYNILKSTVGTSSIHGIPEIFLCKTWLGRLFWFIILLFATSGFYLLLSENIHYFVNQPVTRSIDTTQYPISLVPFPAVTICTTNSVYKAKSQSIQKKLIKNGINPDIAKSFFKKLGLLRGSIAINTSMFEEIIAILPKIGYSNTNHLMEDVAPPCASLLQNCAWNSVATKCSKLFTMSKAEIGICCSFNSDIYPVKSKNEYYTTAGPLHGLYVQFNMSDAQHESSIFHSSTNYMFVYVHGKYTYAQELSYITFVGPGKEINMKMLPDINDAEPFLRQVNVQARQCLMDGEGFNYLNQTYSVANCMILCKRDALLKFCGCIPFYYPETDSGRACSLLDVPCLAQFQRNYTRFRMRFTSRGNSESNSIICDCLPSCSAISYSGSMESLVYPKRSGIILKDQAAIRVYFQNHFCIKYRTTRSLSGDTFIGLVGGLFALCLGGSILSIIEIIFKLIKFAVLYSKQKIYKPQLYWNELQPVKNKM